MTIHTVTPSLLTATDLLEGFAIFTVDLDGIITDWNSGAARLHGLSHQEAIGRHLSILYLPEDVQAKKPEQELDEALTHHSYEIEDYRKKQNGDIFLATITIAQVRDPTSQEHTGYIIVHQDITKRHQKETDQLDANALLKKEITQRKKKLKKR